MRRHFKLMKVPEDAHNRLKSAASIEGKALQDFVDELSKKVAEERFKRDEEKRRFNDGFF